MIYEFTDDLDLENIHLNELGYIEALIRCGKWKPGMVFHTISENLEYQLTAEDKDLIKKIHKRFDDEGLGFVIRLKDRIG